MKIRQIKPQQQPVRPRVATAAAPPQTPLGVPRSQGPEMATLIEAGAFCGLELAKAMLPRHQQLLQAATTTLAAWRFARRTHQAWRAPETGSIATAVQAGGEFALEACALGGHESEVGQLALRVFEQLSEPEQESGVIPPMFIESLGIPISPDLVNAATQQLLAPTSTSALPSLGQRSALLQSSNFHGWSKVACRSSV